MKKFLAILLCLILSFSLCISVTAKISPVAKEKIQVEVKKGSGTITNADGSTIEKKPDITYTVEDGHVIVVNPNEDVYGKFDSWSVYKVVKEGDQTKYVAAVAGVDYIIHSGSLTEKSIKFTALVDLVICANYGETITDPELNSSEAGKKPESPQTSDFALPMVLTFALASVCVLGFKKITVK